MSDELKQLIPPYYAVIFTAKEKVIDKNYQDTASRMRALAEKSSGFLGFEATGNGSLSIAISYWKTMDSIKAWKNHPEHLEAQEKGKAVWYDAYTVRICKVEKEYANN